MEVILGIQISEVFLATYRSSRNGVIRYYKSYFNNGPTPRNKQELFNRCHASLRSIIERTFGVWKKKWRILYDFPRYDIHVQKRVVTDTMGRDYIILSEFQIILMKILLK